MADTAIVRLLQPFILNYSKHKGKIASVRKYWDIPAGPREEAPEQVRMPDSVLIGDVRISPATILAPMAGVTDTVFRRFIKNLGGCGLIMTEVTSADGLFRCRRSHSKRYLHFYDDEHPISAQLFGSDAEVLAGAAK